MENIRFLKKPFFSANISNPFNLGRSGQMLEYISPTLLFPIATLCAIVLFFINYLYDKKEKAKPQMDRETGAEAVDEAIPQRKRQPRRYK